MDKFDVVVVGAGPAGSVTARYAAVSGLDVIILEKKKEVGYPVQCGEFLPTAQELKGMMPSVHDLDGLYSFDESLISRHLHKIRIISPKGRRYEIDFKGFSVDRRAFDKHLLALAVKEGAEVRTGLQVTGVSGSEVITKDGEVISGKVIVGADGYGSTIRTSVGLQAPGLLSPCVLSHVPGDFEPVMQMHFGKVAPGGFGWVIPKKGMANIGLGIRPGSGMSMVHLLAEYRKQLGIDAEPDYLCAGYVPMSGPVERTVKGNAILVGDAAGQVMATNGGGIPIAMVCGRIAGNAIGRHINEGLPLERYDAEWRRAVGAELANAVRTKRLADRFFNWNAGLELAMRLLGNKRIERAVKCKPIFRRKG